jgi:hypothetical protein
MKIKPEGENWVIVYGEGQREYVFSFFVDDNRASWVRRPSHRGFLFRTLGQAQDALREIRRRATARRGVRR